MALIKVTLKLLFGESVSFFIKNAKRKFGINYGEVKLWLFVIKQFVKLWASAKCLKGIEKCGGIDFCVAYSSVRVDSLLSLKRFRWRRFWNKIDCGIKLVSGVC
ncbi:50S ribosomal protein L28 [Candidatus Hodgkinia cicadicola]|nr:50S ribosomal protein L28 [Candidatus Hodgkinia cicadicola]